MNEKSLQRNAHTAVSELLNTLIPPTQRHRRGPPLPGNEREIGMLPASLRAKVVLAPMRHLQGTYGLSTSIVVETATASFTTYSTSMLFDVPPVETPIDQPSYTASAAASDFLAVPPDALNTAADGSATRSSTTETLEITIAPSEFTTTSGGIPPTGTLLQISTTPLSAIYAPQTSSRAFQTSKMTTSSSAAPQSTTMYPPWHGSTQCDKNPQCEEATNEENEHRGEIAGPVTGGIGFLVLVFAAVMLCRWHRRRNKQKNIEDTATWSDKAKAGSQSSTSHTNGTSLDHAVTNHNRGRSRQKSLELLGEPGPAISTDGALESLHRKTELYLMALDYSGSHNRNHRVSGSTLSNASAFPDPFHTSIDINENFTPDLPRPARSSIGLALTRYSTADMNRAHLISRPQSPPKLVAQAQPPGQAPHQTITPLQERQNGFTPRPSNRNSALSAQPSAKDPEEPIICNARVVTTHRHSFTPRIITIVAGQNGEDAAHSDSNDNKSTERRTVSTRARSASPQKAPAYSGSPMKLNPHFGIETWGMQAGRTSSERAGAEFDRAGSSNSTRGQAQERGEGGNISTTHPPSSHPELVRTLPAVKKTIRADKEGAFSGVGSGSGFREGAKKDGRGVARKFYS